MRDGIAKSAYSLPSYAPVVPLAFD